MYVYKCIYEHICNNDKRRHEIEREWLDMGGISWELGEMEITQRQYSCMNFPKIKN